MISGKFSALSGCARRLVDLYNSLSNSTLRQLIKWSSRVQGHLTHNLTVVTKEVFLEVSTSVLCDLTHNLTVVTKEVFLEVSTSVLCDLTHNLTVVTKEVFLEVRTRFYVIVICSDLNKGISQLGCV